MSLGGIFDDSSENGLATVNKVYVPQCSGDAWSGSPGGLNSNQKFYNKYYVRGVAIYKALIRHLVLKRNLG